MNAHIQDATSCLKITRVLLLFGVLHDKARHVGLRVHSLPFVDFGTLVWNKSQHRIEKLWVATMHCRALLSGSPRGRARAWLATVARSGSVGSPGFIRFKLSCKWFWPAAKSAHEIQHDISLSLHLYILSITANDVHCRTRPWSEIGASVIEAASSSGQLTSPR